MTDIIIIQLARLGDIIQSIPLIEDIRDEYSDANIYLIINDVFKECEIFLKGITVIPIVLEDLMHDNITTNVKSESDIIFKQYFGSLNHLNALLINLNNSAISRKIADFIVSDRKYGFGMPNSAEWSAFITSFLKTRHLNSINLVDIFRRFFHSASNIQTPSNSSYQANLERNSFYKACLERDSFYKACLVRTYPDTKQKKIAIQCGARNVKRQFQKKHYLDIANHYLKKNYEVYLLGLKSESITAKFITDTIKNKNLIDTTGKTDLQGLIDILSSCELVYTPDTGTMHLAALCKTPFVALFRGPAFPFETLAYTDKATIYMPDKESFPCYPCNDDDICQNGFACGRFDFKKLFDGKENQGFINLTVNHDEIGQVLAPMEELASLWRHFTKYYFFDLPCPPSVGTHLCCPNPSVGTHLCCPNPSVGNALVRCAMSIGTNDTDNATKTTDLPYTQNELLKRELKLWEMIDIDDLEIAENNFYFLKPLIYFNKLYKDNTLIKEAIRFYNYFLDRNH